MSFDYLGARKEGYSHEEIAGELARRGVKMDVSGASSAGYSDTDIAKEIANRFSTKAGKETGDAYTDYVMGDGVIPSVLRGLTTAANRTKSYINTIQDVTNKVTDAVNMEDSISELIGAPKRQHKPTKPILDKAQIASELSRLESKKEEVSQRNITPERKAKIDKLNADVQNSHGLDAVIPMAKKVADMAITPSEWTMQGIVENLTPTDMVNMAGAGLGSAMAAPMKSTLLKSVLGATGGVIEGGGANGIAEYSVARNRGLTHEEAVKQAVPAAVIGSVIGAPIGIGAGAGKEILSSIKNKSVPVEKPKSFKDIVTEHMNKSEEVAPAEQATNNVTNDIPSEQIATTSQIETPPLTPREQFIQSVTKARGEEEALMNINLIDAKAKTEGITTDDWLTKNGLKVEQHATDGAEFVGKGDSLNQIHPEVAKNIDIPTELPTSAEFHEAVRNTYGAEITPDGLKIDLVRYQKEAQDGAESVRTGVFYLPNGADTAKHYKTGKNGYGGTIKYEGETLLKKPLFVKGATGGKAPEAAYTALKGKGAINDLSKDIIQNVYKFGRKPQEEDVYHILEKYGADADLAWHILENSKEGNTLRYAIQENIIAHTVREAGYDSIIGFSKGKSGNKISEVFDVRESHYPSKEYPAQIHGDFNVIANKNTDELLQKLPSETVNALVQFGVKSKDEANTIIRLFKTADVSSIPHELAHVFRRNLSPQELRSAEKSFGVVDGKWTVENEEAFAEGFVKWLSEGKAPTTELASTFKQFQSWLKELWKTLIKSKEQGFKLTKDHREFYKAMMGDKEAAKKLFSPKAKNARAQRIAMAAEAPVGGSEDAAKQAVKNEFKKHPDSQYKNMSKSDIQALEEEHERALLEEADTLFQKGTNQQEKKTWHERVVNFRALVQDSWAPVEDMIDRKIIQTTKYSYDDLDAARKLFSGRVKPIIFSAREQEEKIVNSIKLASEKHGQDYYDFKDDLNAFLIAQHAPERNKAIGEGAAGIRTYDATASLDALKKSDPEKYKTLSKLADDIRLLNKRSLDILYDGQVISKDLFEGLRTKYQLHVPLNRIMPEDSSISNSISGGKGFSVRSDGLKKAKGSNLEVADILGNVIANINEATIRAEKNRVGLAAHAMFSRVDNSHLADIKSRQWSNLPDGRKNYEPATNDVIVVRVNGEQVIIAPKDKVIAHAFNSMGVVDQGIFLRYMAIPLRHLAGLYTRFSPEFMLTNKIRDFGEAVFYNSTEISLRKAARASLSEPQAINAVRKVLFSPDSATDEWSMLYKQMIDDGGTTGGIAMSMRDDILADLEKIERVALNAPYRALTNGLDMIDKWNTIFEDSTRLAAYKQALDSGMNRTHSAIIAKEVTIDFNRKGNWTPHIASLFMFSNPGIQGTYKMMRMMKRHPKTVASLSAIIGASAIAISSHNDNIDPDWRHKVSSYERDGSFVILLGHNSNGELVKLNIPLAYSLRMFKAVSDGLGDYKQGKVEEGTAIRIVSSSFNSYNPLGGNDLMQMLTPTLARPYEDIARNKNFMGKEIYPSGKEWLPQEENYKKKTAETPSGRFYIGTARVLNESQFIDVSPESLKMLANTYGGGPLSFSAGVYDMVKQSSDGNLSAEDVVFIRKLYKTVSKEDQDMQIGFQAVDRAIDKVRNADSMDRMKTISSVVSSIPPASRGYFKSQLKRHGLLTPHKKDASNAVDNPFQ